MKQMSQFLENRHDFQKRDLCNSWHKKNAIACTKIQREFAMKKGAIFNQQEKPMISLLKNRAKASKKNPKKNLGKIHQKPTSAMIP